MATPAEIIPYLRGKKAETEEEGAKIRQIYDGWTARIERALGRAKDSAQQREILQEILNSLPEPFKTSFEVALKKFVIN